MRKPKATMKFYDNGGKTADRYTAVFLYDRDSRNGTYTYVGMSGTPFHPLGIGYHGEGARLGKHLGKRISFAALPLDCQRLVMRDLALDNQVLVENVTKL